MLSERQVELRRSNPREPLVVFAVTEFPHLWALSVPREWTSSRCVDEKRSDPAESSVTQRNFGVATEIGRHGI